MSENEENLDLPAELANLEPAKRNYALLRAKGHSRTYAIKSVGRTGHPSTPQRWEWSDWWPAAYEAACDLVARNMLVGITPLVGEALEAYRFQLSTHHHAGVAQDVLDRAWGKPIQRLVTQGHTPISIHIDCGGLLPEALEACSALRGELTTIIELPGKPEEGGE